MGAVVLGRVELLIRVSVGATVPIGFKLPAERGVAGVPRWVRHPWWVRQHRPWHRGNGFVTPLVNLLVVVKPFRAAAVLRAVAEFGADAGTVREAKGFGRQKGYLDRYRGGEFGLAYLPKVEISVWVTADRATELADKLAKAARTGRIGDGKIFAVPCMGMVEF